MLLNEPKMPFFESEGKAGGGNTRKEKVRKRKKTLTADKKGAKSEGIELIE